MSILGILYLILTSTAGIFLTLTLSLPFSNKAKVLLGPSIGMILITQVTLIISLFLGFSWISIVLSLSIFLALSLIFIFIFKVKLTLKPDKPKIKNLIQTHWPLIFAFLTFGLYGIWMFWNRVLTPTAFGLVTGGGGLWADTAMHSAFTMSIVERGLPPQNPLFAGQPLIYPFMVNLLSASLVKLGMNLRFAFILPQIIFFLTFIALFYVFAKKILAKRAIFIAFLIFFLGWGLGFTKYFQDVQTRQSWRISEEYTHDYKTFRMHNVLSGLIFPERAFLPGLIIGLLITCFFANQLVIARSEETKQSHSSLQSIIIGILLGILPLWHTHTFLFFGVSIIFWYLITLIESIYKRDSVQFQNIIKKSFVTLSIALFISLPQLFWIRQQVTQTSFLTFSRGWMNPDNVFKFWWLNTGLIIPLAFFAFIKFNRQNKYFFLPVFLMFIIANIVIFQPWDWDNIKLLTFVFLFLSLLAAYMLNQIAKILYFGKPLVVLLLFTLTASGMLSLMHLTPQTHTIYDNEGIELANWVRANTINTDTFLIDPWVNHPVPGLTGRSVYIGYPGQLWVHGIKYYDREQQVKKIMAGNINLLSQIQIPVNYLVIESSKEQLFSKIEHKQVYKNEKFVVFSL